jgi:hypothetical protein
MSTADASFCVQEFDKVTKKVQELVVVRTEYIANAEEGGKQVACMHGTDECDGNKQQLCLQEHTPPDKTMALFFPSLVCHMAASPSSDITPLKKCMAASAVPDSIQQKVSRRGTRGTHVEQCVALPALPCLAGDVAQQPTGPHCLPSVVGTV